jgi:hypothetical protein
MQSKISKNPHSLTIHQHIFPKKSIQRFYNKSGYVEVFLRKRNKRFCAKANNQVFCTTRTWDQKSEDLHKHIEDSFQSIVEQILIGRKKRLTGAEEEAVGAMFALWHGRNRLHETPLPDEQLNGIEGPLHPPSQDDLDMLEKKHLASFNADGAFPGRALSWPFFQLHIGGITQMLRMKSWGIVTATEGEFLAPDGFITPILPIMPGKCFVWGYPSIQGCSMLCS